MPYKFPKSVLGKARQKKHVCEFNEKKFKKKAAFFLKITGVGGNINIFARSAGDLNFAHSLIARRRRGEHFSLLDK